MKLCLHFTFTSTLISIDRKQSPRWLLLFNLSRGYISILTCLHPPYTSSLKEQTFFLCKDTLPCTEGMFALWFFFWIDSCFFTAACYFFSSISFTTSITFFAFMKAYFCVTWTFSFDSFGFNLLRSHEIWYFRENNSFLLQLIDDCNGLVTLVFPIAI